MKKSIRSYRIFAGKVYLIITSIITVLLAFVHFAYGMSLLNPYIGGIAMIPAVAMFSCIADYFVYAGIANRRSGNMAYARTSIWGEDMIRRGVTVDSILNGVRSFLTVFCGGLAAMFASHGTVTAKDVLMIFGMWGNCYAIIGGVNLICRRVGKMLVTIFLFDYLGVLVASMTVFAWLPFILDEQQIANELIIMAIIAIVFVVIAIVLNMLCVSDAVKAYRSGFEDEPVRG